VLRQGAGPNNALGRVKFMMPNQYAIYFHDTNAKSLFDLPERAYSSGCIRVSDPEALARAGTLLTDIDSATQSANGAANGPADGSANAQMLAPSLATGSQSS